MSIRLQVILILMWIVLLIFLIKQIRKRSIDLKHSLAWLLLDVALICVTVFPSLLIKISELFGVEIPTNIVFFLGMCLILIINYTQTVALSRMSERQKNLVQHIALTEYGNKLQNEKYKED